MWAARGVRGGEHRVEHGRLKVAPGPPSGSGGGGGGESGCATPSPAPAVGAWQVWSWVIAGVLRKPEPPAQPVGVASGEGLNRASSVRFSPERGQAW